MSLDDARSTVWELVARSVNMDLFRTRLGCVDRNFYRFIGQLWLTNSSTSPWRTLFTSWTFSIARGPAWSTRHRTKCRHADDMLGGKKDDNAEARLARVPDALESLAAVTRAMAGGFCTGTQQWFPAEICAAYDYSGDLVVALRWVGLDEPPPLSLNGSRVLPVAFLLVGTAEIDVNFRCGEKLSNY